MGSLRHEIILPDRMLMDFSNFFYFIYFCETTLYDKLKKPLQVHCHTESFPVFVSNCRLLIMGAFLSHIFSAVFPASLCSPHLPCQCSAPPAAAQPLRSCAKHVLLSTVYASWLIKSLILFSHHIFLSSCAILPR